MRSPALLAAVALLSACSPSGPPAETAAVVTVTDAWCRPTPNGATAAACYVTAAARGGDDRLVGVSSPVAGMAMVHEMTMQNGVMKMGDGPSSLPLAAGHTVVLAPGGTHLMLMDLKGPLTAGSTVSLTLDFAKAPDVTVQAPVRQPIA